MQVNVTIDFSDLLKKLEHIPQSVTNNVRKELKHWATEIQREARHTHRHSNLSVPRSYRLTGHQNQSIQTYLAPGNGLTSAVYISDSPVDYGKYIHEGFKSWKPDRFLNAAIDKLEPGIIQGLQAAVNNGLQGLNVGVTG